MIRRKHKVISICLLISMGLASLSQAAPIEVSAEEVSAEQQTVQNVATATDADIDDPTEEESAADMGIAAISNETAYVLAEQEKDPEAEVEEEQLNLKYYVHQQTYGNSAIAENGGTAGQIESGKRLEAFTISSFSLPEGLSGTIEYHAHCQTFGWQPWVSAGTETGSEGQKKRLEAIQIRLTGELANEYDVYYRTYMSNYGWLDWTKNGETAGTVGFASVLEGIQVQVVKKGSEAAPKTGKVAALTTDNVNTVYYSGHVQTYGNLDTVQNGQTLGTTGQKKRLEGLKIQMTHQAGQLFGQIKYQVHCQTYGWMDEVTEGTFAGTSGEAKRLEAISISLSGDIAKYCDIYYRVHAQSFGWMGWAKNGEYAGTTGNKYRVEAIQIKILPKGSEASGSTQTAYSAKRYEETLSGYQMLEPYLDRIIAQNTNDSMTREQKLRVLYDYVVHNYTYKTLSADHPANFSWDTYYAYTIVTTGQGNCYAYASLFCMLARKIGYPQAVVNRGSLGSSRRPHGWCEIDGVMYDPEIEYKHPDVPRFAFTSRTNPYSYHYE